MEHNYFTLTKLNRVHFYKDGPAYYDAYVSMIESAQKIIHLQTYIFELDSFGTRVHAALIGAAKRGVKVYVLVDSIGSRLLTQESEDQLKDAGVHFYRFNKIQISWLYRWGRRLHHKILLVDHQVAFVGGINILTTCDKESRCPQLDFAVMLKGPVLKRLIQYCQDVLHKAVSKKLQFPAIPPLESYPDGVDVKILINDWVYRRWQITRQYSKLAKKAKEEITIINSYFYPRKTFMRQLVHAARNGVRVRLILPKISDWPIYVMASQYLYSYFLKNGVEIYQWKKSFLHGKLATIDGNWSTIGSFNLNYTSYQQNLEMNVNIYSEEFTKELKKEIEAIIEEGCEKVDSKEFLENRSLSVRIKRFFYFIVLGMVANFSMGLTYQEDGNKNDLHLYQHLHTYSALFFLLIGLIAVFVRPIPGVVFLCTCTLLLYRQILSNKKKEAV